MINKYKVQNVSYLKKNPKNLHTHLHCMRTRVLCTHMLFTELLSSHSLFAHKSSNHSKISIFMEVCKLVYVHSAWLFSRAKYMKHRMALCYRMALHYMSRIYIQALALNITIIIQKMNKRHNNTEYRQLIVYVNTVLILDFLNFKVIIRI